MGVQNYDCYTDRMAQSIWDKSWWIDKIDHSINTIIDFGCGNGELGKFIEHIFPNRFRYIGIDNDEHMLELASENLADHPYFFIGTDISVIPADVNPNTTIVIMNSVIHELFNYCSEEELASLFTAIKYFGARYIAIRDMSKYPITIFAESLSTKAMAMMKEMYDRADENLVYLVQLMLFRPELDIDQVNLLLEYALKYRYKENWDREVRERYLWNWEEVFGAILRMTSERIGTSIDAPIYGLHYEDSFYIPFIYDAFKKDIGIDMLPIPSHKKVLYERTDKDYIKESTNETEA